MIAMMCLDRFADSFYKELVSDYCVACKFAAASALADSFISLLCTACSLIPTLDLPSMTTVSD